MKNELLRIGACLLLSLFILQEGRAQRQVPIGSWRDHFPYDDCIAVTRSDQKVYAATELGLVSYNTQDNSVERLNKINALTGIGISSLRYSREQDLLVVGYRDGNIDILSDDRTWTLNDIVNSNILASKTVNGIQFQNEFAYLSCGFGVVLLDLDRKEIRETYMIGDNSSAVEVHQTTIYADTLYAATASGLYKASLNAPNLSDFQSWEKMEPAGFQGPFTDIIPFKEKLFLLRRPDQANANDSILVHENGSWKGFEFEPRSQKYYDIERSSKGLVISQRGRILVVDENGKEQKDVFDQPWTGKPQPRQAILWKDQFWWADRFNGLCRAKDPWNGERIMSNGPGTSSIFDLEASEDHLWGATGAVNPSWNPFYLDEGILHFHEDEWSTIQGGSHPARDSLRDPISVAIDPNDPEHVFIGTWGNGLLEFQDGELEEVHTQNNSTLHTLSSYPDIVQVWGCAFDQEGNLWVSNNYPPAPISVLTPDGEWHALDLEGTFGSNDIFGPVICSSTGLKWVILPKGGGLLVIDDGGTPADPSDDQHRVLDGDDGLPSQKVLSVAEDKDQEIWVGTDQGLAVFYTPDDLFSNNPSSAEEILVEHDGFVEPLLQNEEITAIEVDGADRKWLGTSNSGIFQVSADGREELNRFSEENSPLISDNIQDITIHPESGEVIIGTGDGILGYRAVATEGQETLEEIEIYPNPVKKEHHGPVAIRGLPANSTVKITDVSGDLVHRTRSEGGQATWDGTDRDGLKVRSGVYLVFVASPSGEQSMAGKIMFFH